MAYDTNLADRVREYLAPLSHVAVTEKNLFGGLAFLVNEKMCVNVSGANLMCRFDPALQETVAEKRGFQPMIMKGKNLAGYCYVDAIGFTTARDFSYWMELCLHYNATPKPAKKAKAKNPARSKSTKTI